MKNRGVLFYLFFCTFFYIFTKKDERRGKEKTQSSKFFFGVHKTNASQIEYYVVVKGRRGREIAHGVSSETLSGLRVLVRGARGRDSRVWCGRQRRARLLFRGEKCKGKEEDVKETEDQCLYVFVIKIKYSLPSLSLSESLSV